MRTSAALALGLALAVCFVRPAQAGDEDRFVRARLVEAIRLLDTFRVERSGQYLDAVRIGAEDQDGLPSSIAATGIGLVSLAMADALGLDPRAEEKAVHTLRNLVGDDATSGFSIPRSRRGWFPHFVDARTGEPTWGSQGKFSTIDTALLAAGTAIAARYFNARSFTRGEGESDVWRLGGRVVGGVRWASAIKSVERGLVHLVFKGEAEEELMNVFANPFDEYAVLPCMAMRGEQLGHVTGPAHALFTRHYSRAQDLPMIDFEGTSVIAKPSGNPIPHFTHLFPWFYCNAFNTQGAYARELRELTRADRAWFARRRLERPMRTAAGGFPVELWGLGAGAEVKFRTEGPRRGEVARTGYGVNSLARNPHDTASPAIMAGLASVFRNGDPGDPVRDLMRLWERGTCRYEHEGIPFLWRCSARDPALKVRKVEAVDFSTYLLGLAARDPAFGMPFLRNFNL